MALQCLGEVLISICDKICRGDEEEEEVAKVLRRLPNCIVSDIVSRLPIEVLVRCQSQKDLGALMSSHDFTTLHLSRAKSTRTMLLLHDYKDKNKLFHMTRTLKLYRLPQLKKLGGRIKHPPHIRFSCEGVLLLVNHLCCPPTYYVFNPTTREEVVVRHTHLHAVLLALYYCPFERQFKLLLAKARGHACQYLVYVVKTQTWREIRTSTNINLLPQEKGSPAIVNGALYWMMYYDLQTNKNNRHDGLPSCENNGIIVFKMDTEKIYAKPHPGSVCKCTEIDKEHRLMMTLIVKENNLCFCHLLADVPGLALDIWILEDYKMWAWNKTYNIHVFPSGPVRNPRDVKPFYIHDGQLLFYIEYYASLYRYDLRHKTLDIITPSRKHNLRPFGSYLDTFLPI